jgi:8-oxo-dGTP pyrophosphatase MutT (NUDIX family)
MGPPGEQLVEWVDADGRVLGIVTRGRMRAENLRHRSVYVAVLDADGALVVHRRADWKDVWPGSWDLAFGGVVGIGESWPAAARRELAEEAGIEAVELHELGAFTYDDGFVSLLGRAYLTRASGPVEPRDGEVVELASVPIADLAGWAARRPVCPDSLAKVLPLLAGHLAGG